METKSPIALLLRSETTSPNDQRVGAILHFWDIPWVPVTVQQAKYGNLGPVVGSQSIFSVLTSAQCLGETLQGSDAGTLPDWLRQASSVFVYGFEKSDSCETLLRKLSGHAGATVRALEARPLAASITDFPEVCGPMSGLQMQLEPGAVDSAFVLKPGEDFLSIIAVPEGHLFVRFVHFGVTFFGDASRSVLDIHQRSASYFDVKRSFGGAVALVMYLKWAFRAIGWTTHETSACLIIDDPLLTRRYGFLDFRKLAQLANAHTFATTIAFIPWNWRRTREDTIRLFRENRDKLSVCVHGCDHVGGEFATRSISLIDGKLRLAKSRMKALCERTGLHHDRVMVFPQGAFSPEVGQRLKLNGFLAAVNTEVAPANKSPNETTIADLWSVSILRYGGFAIFTRRYITHGIENFAFDGLLGKPCFIVGHHELFQDCGKLVEFVRRLNSLNWKLTWRTLGSAVNRCYRAQRLDGVIRVSMFTEQLIIENMEAVEQKVTIVKKEEDIASVEDVTANTRKVDYDYLDGCLQFVVSVPAKGVTEIQCSYYPKTDLARRLDPLSYKLRVALRRYLSEFRDNYLSRNEFLSHTVAVARRLLKKDRRAINEQPRSARIVGCASRGDR